MGLSIKEKDGLYKATSTISDENITDGFVSINQIKKDLIDCAFWDFIDKIMTIQMNFPNMYRVNDVYVSPGKDVVTFNDWYSSIKECDRGEATKQKLIEMFKENPIFEADYKFLLEVF